MGEILGEIEGERVVEVGFGFGLLGVQGIVNWKPFLWGLVGER